MRRIGLAIVLVVGPAWLAAQGQGEPPSFRAGVELIQLDVSVLDGKRLPVRGLTAPDFTVLENGVAKPIRAFTAVDLPPSHPPAEAGWVDAVVPDVVTNQAGEQDGRLVIILMDRSIHVGQNTVQARKIATTVVEGLGPHDLGAVVSTSGGVPQNLTSDRTRLLKTINERDWSTDSDFWPFTLQEPLDDGRCLCGVCVLDTVRRVSDAVRDAPRRRKVLFFIGSGVVMQVGLSPGGRQWGCDTLVEDARNALFKSLALSSLTVHSLDPSGLSSVGPQTRASERGGLGPGAEAARLAAQQRETSGMLDMHGTLEVLPERTGGRVVVNTNGPESKVAEIFRESEAYYVIAFDPGTPGGPDDRRSIEVKVARKGVRAYTQRQYQLPGSVQPAASRAPAAPAAASPLDAAIGRLLPVASRPLGLNVAAFAGPEGGQAFVSINLDAHSFARDGVAPGPLDIAVAAADQTGRQIASARQTSTVAASSATSGRAAAVSLRTHLNLEAGDYEIRAAVADRNTGLAASVFSQITIPHFARAPLSLSDLVIASGPASDSTADPGSLLPVVPTMQRSFSRADRIRPFVQIYQGTGLTTAIVPVSVHVHVVDASGRAVHDQTLALTGEDFQNRRANCQITLPLASLTPGEYLLSVDAAAEKQTARRALRFTVE